MLLLQGGCTAYVEGYKLALRFVAGIISPESEGEMGLQVCSSLLFEVLSLQIKSRLSTV